MANTITRSQPSTSNETNSPHTPNTPQNLDHTPLLIPCAATPELFLFARGEVIYCIQLEDLSLVRKLKKHTTDITILTTNNICEVQSGQRAISCDAEYNAIIWDLATGEELVRLASLTSVRVASWMPDGRVVLGDTSGAINLLNAFTGAHELVRTVNVAINALAPSHDGGTVAIGYDNGSILVVTVEPTFSILHSLHTATTPSPVCGLAWHGTLTNARTEMLATHTMNGDLRVWAIPKIGYEEVNARIIRTINQAPNAEVRKVWFSWSRSGKLVQFCDGDTLLWDVRTKDINHHNVPVRGDIIGLTAYGPFAALFAITRDFHLFRYDLTLTDDITPSLAMEVVHVASRPAFSNAARSMRSNRHASEPRSASTRSAAESSESELFVPPQHITYTLDEYDDEERDQLGPLSPTSSRASSTSAASHVRRIRLPPSRYETPGSDFSVGATGQHVQRGRTSRSNSVVPPTRSSALRQEILRSPEGEKPLTDFDLFPQVRDRLASVQMRVPRHGNFSVNEVQQELLRVMFDWQGSARDLVEYEKSRHQQVGDILLSKWLQINSADVLTRMVGSEMSSTDWMLLALSTDMGQGSQRAVGETFVRRLLEAGEVHQAVAVLLKMDEVTTAVDVYASRQCFLEAILLNGILRPQDWNSQQQLLRRWGDLLVNQEQTATAVRCFSCASMTPELPYVSSTDDSYSEAESYARSTPLSPPNANVKNRLAAMNAPLKLVTNFAPSSKATRSKNPQINTAISQEPGEVWRDVVQSRERSESRTATPGGIGRHRIPSTGPRTSSANRRGGSSSTVSRASSQQHLSSSATLRTPSTARTARPSDAHIVGRDDRRGQTGYDRRATPDASHILESSDTGSQSESADVPLASEPEDWGWLGDASRRASTMLAMQTASERHYPPQPAAPTGSLPSINAAGKHRRHASDNLPSTRSLVSSAREIDRPGSAGNHMVSQPVTTLAERLPRSQNSGANTLEERRRSLLRRPSVPAIPHPRDLVPQATGSSTGQLLLPTVYVRGAGIERSATADPSTMLRQQRFTNLLQNTHQAVPGIEQVPPTKEDRKGERPPPPLFLLPATTYQRPDMRRAATAPPEELGSNPRLRRRPSSQFETIPERPPAGIEIRPGGPRLPQLQHLGAQPPPPPTTSTPRRSPTTDDESSGFIHIGTDDPTIASPIQLARSPTGRRPSFNRTMTASPPAPPSATRTTLGSKWLGRIRSSSRTQSQDHTSPSTSRMPYETVLDIPGESRAGGGGGRDEALQRTISPASATQGYRNPKEIRDRLKEREADMS